MAAGIEERHARDCRARAGGRCDCRPSYRAQVFDKRTGRRIRRTFPTHAAAKTWRQDAIVAVRKGTLSPGDGRTVEQVCDEWLGLAREGVVRNRSGDPYKPSAVRGYEQALRLRVHPRLGARRFADVRRRDLQDLVDRLVAQGLAPSTVQCAVIPLRAVYRRALARGELDVNPTAGLEVPAIRSGRDRFATPQEAASLLAALPEQDRAVWAAALYAGLRRGELMALRWEDVDLDAGTIRVERGWDLVEHREIAPKSRDGARTVPIAKALRAHLAAHGLATGRRTGLVFTLNGTGPFEPGKLTARADKAWRAAKLDRITLHECRHTFASLMIAAGVNAKALSTYMGHANIAITLDRYGHLMPGNEGQAAGLLDAYLDAAAGAGQGA